MSRCMKIKETEGLTAGQIKAVNLSICLISVQSKGRAREGSERQDYKEEISGGGEAGDREWKETAEQMSCSMKTGEE